MRVFYDDADRERDWEDEIMDKASGFMLAMGIATGLLTIIQGVAIAVLIAHMTKVQLMLELMLR